MHFHGVEYTPDSDGAFVPGFSGPDGDVKVGQTWTYDLRAGHDSVGVWPYHDHGPSMDAVDRRRDVRRDVDPRPPRAAPDREFVVLFTELGGFETIDGRAFVGNTPVFHSRSASACSGTFWRWATPTTRSTCTATAGAAPTAIPLDTRTLGPAESFRVQWHEDAPGTWLYHCHVESHMANGMIGLYRVSR